MTTALEGGKGSASRPGRSLPPGKTRYPLYRRPSGPQGGSGHVRKILPPAGFRSPDRPARNQSLYRLSYPGPVYDVPCIEFYPNQINSVESINKILFTPLSKQIITKLIIIERHRDFYIEFHAHRSVNMESRDRTSFRPWSKAWLLLGRILLNLLENFVTNFSTEFQENPTYGLTTVTDRWRAWSPHEAFFFTS